MVGYYRELILMESSLKAYILRLVWMFRDSCYFRILTLVALVIWHRNVYTLFVKNAGYLLKLKYVGCFCLWGMWSISDNSCGKPVQHYKRRKNAVWNWYQVTWLFFGNKQRNSWMIEKRQVGKKCLSIYGIMDNIIISFLNECIYLTNNFCDKQWIFAYFSLKKVYNIILSTLLVHCLVLCSAELYFNVRNMIKTFWILFR